MEFSFFSIRMYNVYTDEIKTDFVEQALHMCIVNLFAHSSTVKRFQISHLISNINI